MTSWLSTQAEAVLLRHDYYSSPLMSAMAIHELTKRQIILCNNERRFIIMSFEVEC